MKMDSAFGGVLGGVENHANVDLMPLGGKVLLLIDGLKINIINTL